MLKIINFSIVPGSLVNDLEKDIGFKYAKANVQLQNC